METKSFFRKKILYTFLLILLFIFITASFGVVHFKNRINELFMLNKLRQEQNYYMAEFEFKMLGIGYHIDKGNYFKAIGLTNRLYKKLKTGNGLIKVPHFENCNGEIDFYLNLQNPKTGAFMDDAYPLSSYHGPTENVLLHLEKLFIKAKRPFKINHPLKYLDRINTPSKLVKYLNDVSTVGFIASKFPQTTFHNARDILNLSWDEKKYNSGKYDLVVQRHNLYQFSDGWKHTLLKWFYENQDPETGLWGPKSASGKLMKKDLNNTSSVLKTFRDYNGKDIHREFPLRYKDQLFSSALKVLAEKVPKDRKKLSEWHEWYLKTAKATRMLTRNLWSDAKKSNIKKARSLIRDYVTILYENYYIPEGGAFSYYPGGKKATLDGIQKYFVLTKDIGAFDREKQNLIWGESNIYSTEITKPDPDLLAELAKEYGINSFRLFKGKPHEDLYKNAFAVYYPTSTKVLDAVDISCKLERWIKKTDLTMGNWSSIADIKNRIEKVPFVKIYHKTIPGESLKNVYIVGFDTAQVPILKIRVSSNK